MFGQLSHELEVNVPASEAWEIYGTLGISKLLVEDGSAFEKIEVLEGDGESDTILKKTFMPGYKLVNVLIFFLKYLYIHCYSYDRLQTCQCFNFFFFLNNYIYTHTKCVAIIYINVFSKRLPLQIGSVNAANSIMENFITH